MANKARFKRVHGIRKTFKEPSSQNLKDARRNPEHDTISLWILEADIHVVWKIMILRILGSQANSTKCCASANN